ncbi:lysophospholipid acyltransferase family protein [Fodinibius salsisoli]|uniref:Lysophospholipid acyltransferase family protein n=1 Tax=Fodinibius salsisoli TaxID=2820877 RepID=A0ABT3PNH7_9BACT|nr:lysophospholipid acyltransferase family protein [Fodinibius salsisoli]MCW9707408.1 lysophospholipid acyltransferase family protein [Fodinibius salsisoli]
MAFIPADESPWFIKCFRIYTWLLFKRRFSNVWLIQDYHPERTSRTIYYLNHHSWWDGLIPFLLNEFRFHQQARAMMEDKQMQRYPFFRKIGAFSISREDPKSSIRSLRYAVKSLLRPSASLYIYPEGKITPPGSNLIFKNGLSWLGKQVSDIDIVPIGIYMHTIRSDKPELHLSVGSPVPVEPKLSNEERSRLFEQKLEAILSDLQQTAGFDDAGFERFI